MNIKQSNKKNKGKNKKRRKRILTQREIEYNDFINEEIKYLKDKLKENNFNRNI